MKAANSAIKTAQSHLKDIDKALKLDPKNIDMLKAKQNALNEVIAETKKKLDMEKEAAINAKKALETGEITQSEYDALQAEIITTTDKLKDLEKQARQSASVMGSVMQTVGEDIKKVGDNIQAAGEKIQEVGDKVSSMGGKMSATITAPVVASGTLSVKEATDYGSSLAKLSTIADTSKVSVDDLDKAITDLSSQTGMSAANIAEASYQAISAGQSTEDAVKFVEQANILARAGFTDMTTATDTLTTALNAYELEASEVSKISDKLIVTQNLGKTSVNELGSSMGKVIPTAAMYNVNLDQLSAAYVTTTKNGIGTAESTTYINGMLNELGKSGTKASDILKEKTGKSFKELMDDGYSLADVLEIIQDEADSSGKSLADMFGSQEAAKAAASITLHTQDFNEAINALENSAGTAKNAFELLEETDPSIQFEKTKTSIQNASIAIGQMLMPVVQKVAKKAQDLADKFRNLDHATQKQIITIAAIVAAIGPLLMILGKIITLVGSVITIVGKVVTAIGSLTSAIGTAVTFVKGTMIPAITTAISTIAPILPIIAAIVLGIIAIITVIKNWSSIMELGQIIAETVIEKIKEIITGFKEFWTTAFQGIADFFKSIWGNISATAVNAWTGIQNAFSNVGTWFTDKFKQAWDGITGMFSKLGDFFKGVWDDITGIFKTIGTTIADAITGSVKSAVNTVLSGAINIINGFIGAINSVIGVINAIPGVSLSKLKQLNVPQLELGGILKKGQVGLLEGNGAEAVVPLDKNKAWVAAVAKDFRAALDGQKPTPQPPPEPYPANNPSGDIIIPVYIGRDKLDKAIVKANQINDFKSGGR